MTTFWQTRHEVIDEKERKTYNAAVTIQKLFRRFSVRLRMARWVAEEDDDDVASQLENVRVAVAQFCLANHVDFDRVEKKFADVNKSLKTSDGGARGRRAVGGRFKRVAGRPGGVAGDGL